MSLLSELCSICYTEKPKYRCPRCKTQSCSLPCYKTHQKRASCNGQRDPAAYLKKSQLSTPEGIDRDYNYLKGVERNMDNAGRDTRDRGINSKDVRKGVNRSLHPTSNFQKYLATNRITINRAPKGMSRQKTNQTRATKREYIMWTLEWVDSDGKREIQDNCLESGTIEDIHSHHLVERANAEARKLNPDESAYKASKKRKREEREQGPDAHAKAGAEDEITKQEDNNAIKEDDEANESGDEDDVVIKTEPGPEEIPKSKPNHFFYLLKAATTSANKVLIPLMANCTLTEALQDQTVLEYPTIYILPYSPGKLPPGFVNEMQYLKIRKGEEEELDDALIKAENGGFLQNKTKKEADAPSNTVDPNKILDMLRRDVTR